MIQISGRSVCHASSRLSSQPWTMQGHAHQPCFFNMVVALQKRTKPGRSRRWTQSIAVAGNVQRMLWLVLTVCQSGSCHRFKLNLTIEFQSYNLQGVTYASWCSMPLRRCNRSASVLWAFRRKESSAQLVMPFTCGIQRNLQLVQV